MFLYKLFKSIKNLVHFRISKTDIVAQDLLILLSVMLLFHTERTNINYIKNTWRR